jgi:hypothetical protein
LNQGRSNPVWIAEAVFASRETKNAVGFLPVDNPAVFSGVRFFFWLAISIFA